MAHYPKIFDFTNPTPINACEIVWGTGGGITSSNYFVFDCSKINLVMGGTSSLNSATQGAYLSAIIGGVCNTIISSTSSSIISSGYSSIGEPLNPNARRYSSIIASKNSIIGALSDYSVIIGGTGSFTTGNSTTGTILGSFQSYLLDSYCSSIINSQKAKQLVTIQSTIIGGINNEIVSSYNSLILNGLGSTVSFSTSSNIISSGSASITYSNISGILNSQGSIICCSQYSTIISGINSQICNSRASVILNSESMLPGRSYTNIYGTVSNNKIVGGFGNILAGGVYRFNEDLNYLYNYSNKIYNSSLSVILTGCVQSLTASKSSIILGSSNCGTFIYYSSFLSGRENCLYRTNSSSMISSNSSAINCSSNSNIIGSVLSRIEKGTGCVPVTSTIIGTNRSCISISTQNSLILGGYKNCMCEIGTPTERGNGLLILGGSNNTIKNANNQKLDHSAIISSSGSTICNSNTSLILGGTSLSICNENNVVYVPTLKINSVTQSIDTNKVLVWDCDSCVRYTTINAAGVIDICEIAWGTGVGITSSDHFRFDCQRCNLLIGCNQGATFTHASSSYWSVNLGMFCNCINRTTSGVIIGGNRQQIATSSYSSIIGGLCNNITTSSQSVILSSRCSLIRQGGVNLIVGGFCQILSTSSNSSILNSCRSLLENSVYSTIISSPGSTISNVFNSSIISSSHSIIFRIGSPNPYGNSSIGFSLGSCIQNASNAIIFGSCRSSVSGGRGSSIVLSASSSILNDGNSLIIGASSSRIVSSSALLSSSNIIFGGCEQLIQTSSNSMIIGQFCNCVLLSRFSSIISGCRNAICASSCSMILDSEYGLILGTFSGLTNRNSIISSYRVTIATASYSSIIAAWNSCIYSPNTFGLIIGGRNTCNFNSDSSLLLNSRFNLMRCSPNSSMISACRGCIESNCTSLILSSTGSIIIASTSSLERNNFIIGGGIQLIQTSSNTSIIGGFENTINCSRYGTIISSRKSRLLYTEDSTILGSSQSYVLGRSSTKSIGNSIVGGCNQGIGTSSNSSIIGGVCNFVFSSSNSGIISSFDSDIINSSNGFVAGSTTSCVCNTLRGSIITSQGSLICGSTNSTIIGGSGSCICNSKNSAIIGGFGLTLSNENEVVMIPGLKIDSLTLSTDASRYMVWDADRCVRYTESVNSLRIDVCEIAWGSGNSGTGITSSDHFRFDSSRCNFLMGCNQGPTFTHASSSYWSINLGRVCNCINLSNSSVIIGGCKQYIGTSSYNSIIGGRNNKSFASPYSGVFSSHYSTITASNNSLVTGGYKNTIRQGSRSSVISSQLSTTCFATQSSIINSTQSSIYLSSDSGIFTSPLSTITSSNTSLILGGQCHNIGTSSNSLVLGGECQGIYTSQESFILGGNCNAIRTSYGSLILSTTRSVICSSNNSAIIGSSFSFIVSSTNGLVSGNGGCMFSTINSSIIGSYNSVLKNSCGTSIISSCQGYMKSTNYSGIFAVGATISSIISSKSSIILSSNECVNISNSNAATLISSDCSCINSGSDRSIVSNSYLSSIQKSIESAILGSTGSVICDFSRNSAIIGASNSCINNSCNSIILGGKGLTLSSENDVVYLSSLKIKNVDENSQLTKFLSWDDVNKNVKWGNPLQNGITGSTIYYTGSAWTFSNTNLYNDGTYVGIGITNSSTNTYATPSSSLHVFGSLSLDVKTASTSYTLSDKNTTLLSYPSTDITVSLPSAISARHRLYIVKNMTGGGTVSVVPDGSDTIETSGTWPLQDRFDLLMVQSDGVNMWIRLSK